MQGNASTGHDGGRATVPTLLLLFGGVLLGALDIAIVGPALPAIQNQLGLDSREAASVFSVYILFGLIGAPLLASLSDRIGRRRVYVLCLLLFGIGSLIVATAITRDSLLLGRAIQALGASGTLPVASAVIADTFPLERRGRALGLIGAVFGLAFILGPLVGGFFLQWSWRWLFIINLPLVVILIAMSVSLLSNQVRSRPRAFDFAGAALLAVALGAMALGASRLTVNGADAMAINLVCLPFFAVAIVGLVSFWLVEQRVSAPIVQPSMLQSRQMRIICLLGLATGLVEASMVFLPSLAVTALNVRPDRASFMLLPLILALIVGSALAGRLLDSIGPRPVIRTGMACTILGLLLFSELRLTTWSFYLAGFTVGFGLAALVGAPLRYVALDEGGTDNRGASQGLLTVCLGTGRLFGASLTGGIAVTAGAASGYRQAMLLIAGACTVALIATAWLRRGRYAGSAAESGQGS